MSKSLFLGKGTIGLLTKQGGSKFIHDVYLVEGPKHNFLSIGQLIQKGYRIYIEDDHCVIKDKPPSNRLIAKATMTRNRLFPLRIVPDIKGKTKKGAAFKVESEETVELLNKRENCSANLQAAFQTKV